MQWAQPAGDYTGPTHRVADDSPVNMEPITLEELAKVLKGMASHKAPGPDNIPAEALQWLSSAYRQPLVDLF